MYTINTALCINTGKLLFNKGMVKALGNTNPNNNGLIQEKGCNEKGSTCSDFKNVR